MAGTRPHVVYISVVGADRTPVVSRVDRAMFGYVEQKRLSEEVIADSGLPWTTLRANLTPERAVGRRRWEQFLEERVGARSTTVA
ncbi:hypothetical protein [Intrasporangium sp.]|uniref:hypothetical protein n=1 Tax=Intrasporangium sp. TaxID=1925024 RepID=UPI00293A53AD|nr:hypothetical protein [Intrasporangium sp.]MDV3220956.1 hypothetical protein [Intrasporangium sp.]